MRRLLAAVVVSLLLHVLALSGARFNVTEPLPARPPLEARLVSAPPPAAKPVAAPPKPRARPKPALRRSAPPRLQVATVATATPLALPSPPQSPEPGPEPAEPAAPVKPAPETPPAPQVPAAAPARNLPGKGRITYTLFLGTDKFSVGKTVQSWDIEGDTYKLGSISETTGIADLFYSQHLNYLSEGRITAAGLRPETFLMSRKRRGETEVAKANFNWAGGQITLGRVQNRRTEALPAGSQDMMSFIYQLALAPPPPGRVRLPITNGADLETYELDVLKEESIETPLGTLKALPVRQLRHPGEESIEFWLAADYRYLPVKIRFIGREGEQSGEQIVSEIRVSDDKSPSQ
jgi:hypothetical protein